MDCCYRLKRGAIRMAFLFFLCGAILLASLLTAMPARADAGIAISGSFSSQMFEIPQGSSAGGPSINVVVFNQSSTQINVTMVTEAPDGVTIDLSYTNFALQPGEYRQVQIGVAVSADVPPGQYQISVTAQASYEGAGGVQVLPAAGETASLVVTGEAASVTVDTVGPSGEPVVAVIRLFKVINGSNYEVSYSNTGHLEARVSPGSFVVSAYSNGEKLAEQSFDVTANEEKSLPLTVETVYFEGFRITPAYHTQTHELGYVQIAYTVTNVYQPMANAEVRLVVTLNGASLEEVSLLTQNPLDVGSIGVPYHYVPAWGWEKGTYGFSLQLYADNQLYASTTGQTLAVGIGGSRGWMWIIIGIIGGGLGLLGLGVLVLRRRKRGGRPAKLEKRRQPMPAGKEIGVAGVFARRGILDADDSFKMKPAAARPGGNGKGTSLAKATGVEKEKAGLSAAGILKKIKVWERIGRFRKKGEGNGHDGGERPAGGPQPAGKQANVAGTTGFAKSAPPAAAGGLPRQSNIVKEAAMRKPSSPAAGNATKEGVAKQASASKTPDVAKQTPPAVGHDKENDASKAADVQKQSPATSDAAKEGAATQATGAVKETTGVSKAFEAREAHTGPKVIDIGKEYVPPQSTSDAKTSGAPKMARFRKEAPAHAPGSAGNESADGEASDDSRQGDDGAQVSKDKDKKPAPPVRFLNR